jgi:hypothetical protein
VKLKLQLEVQLDRARTPDLAQVVAAPHSTVPNLGASGAIAAVMRAFIVTYPRDQIKPVLFIFVFARITFIPAGLLIGVWFVTQLVHAGAVAHVQTGGVAYLAHVGGFIFGALTARFFEDPRRVALQPPAIDCFFEKGRYVLTFLSRYKPFDARTPWPFLHPPLL